MRVCSRCRSYHIRESQRHGWLEQVVLRLILMRPYRCHQCHRRFYGFGLTWHSPCEGEGDE